MASGYAITNWIFLRALFLVYAVAFFSVAAQARGLWGSQGILPITAYLEGAAGALGRDRAVLRLPSLFWLSSGDGAIIRFALAGAACALLGLIGVLQGWMLVACFLFYLSYSTAGQDFLSFQWDSLLLEVGFLALFAAPWLSIFEPWIAHEPARAVRWMFYVVLFKLMFLSGVVKLQSGDRSWRDFSALTYHYWTQPLPNPVAPFVHALPQWLHQASTAMTFVIELGVPFLIFWPRARLIPALGFTALSFLILSTGNFAFFNWLTLALTFWLLPDPIWSRLLVHLPLRIEVAPPSLVSDTAFYVALAPLFLISLFWCVRWALPSTAQTAALKLIRWSYEFRFSSPYGLFATMTKTRPEITIEGSLDGRTWKSYEFKYKPGDLDRAPPFVAPHQPRLDWQMWFAALGPYDESEWLQNLEIRLLQGSPDVLALLGRNPFPEHPPREIRARLDLYEFTSPSEIFSSGRWWKPTPLGPFGPTLERRE